MAEWWDSDDVALRTLAIRRLELSIELEKLLLRKKLIGDWTPRQHAAYDSLCEEEREILDRMAVLEDPRLTVSVE